MILNFVDRLHIPIDGEDIKLYTKSNILIANGYKRIVIGKRGPYVEFDKENINHSICYIPEKQKWRLTDTEHKAFYIEWRTKPDYIKLYEQLKEVDYADYIIGMWYISPFDLYTGDGELIITPLLCL